MDFDNNTYNESRFTELDNIVYHLYRIGLLTDIECRKIALTGLTLEAREAILEIILTKDVAVGKKIIKIFRSSLFPIYNPKILNRIFSFLNCDDMKKCKLVCKDWNVVIDCLTEERYTDKKIIDPSWDVYEDHDKVWNLDGNWMDKMKRHFHHNLSKKEKQALVFLVLLSRAPGEVETTVMMLRNKETSYLDYFESLAIESNKSSSCEIEQQWDHLVLKVLGNHTVLNTTFKFLSLNEIKKCRFVCRSWNHVGESHLKRKSDILFTSSFRPKMLLNIAKYSSLPDLQFAHFHFTQKFPHDELTTFFSNFGKCIRSIKFDQDLWLSTPIYLPLTSNLTELFVQGDALNCGKITTDQMIPFETLHSIKILVLEFCSVHIPSDLKIRRITPIKMLLQSVNFFLGESIASKINDFVDFTEAKYVKIVGCNRGTRIFDWGKEIFNMERLELSNMFFVNTNKSKSSVNYFKLNCAARFSGKVSIRIKNVLYKDATDILDISVLPATIEKIAIRQSYSANIVANHSINFPNINYLSALSCNSYKFLSFFKHCTNLTHLEITGRKDFDITWLPRSIKTIKIDCDSSVTFIGGSAEDIFHLDWLILGFVTCHDLNDISFKQIRPKNLVLQLTGGYHDNLFISFLQRNSNMEKIYVQFDCYHEISLASSLESDLYWLVDIETGFYELSNGRGRAITKEEFFVIKRIADWQTVMKELSRRERTSDHRRKAYDDLYEDIVSYNGITN